MCLRKKIAFVVFYQKQNIYSFNALIAAIETAHKLDEIEIYFIRGYENLYNDLERISESYGKSY
ncbi:unnamed protein product [marine sediment metagenome]|uniref:Uncharacterized protein n=1 Tax=marine sediment metagenome TaxID=412755 RepID=X1CS98_9ZZZZ